jgi:hypothetical protein
MPYYLSTLDEKMWRSGLSDMLYLSTWVPGMNEVSSNFKNPLLGYRDPQDFKNSSV